MRIDVNPIMAKLSFSKFEKWHKETMKHDTMTAEERYISLGGKIDKPKKKGD